MNREKFKKEFVNELTLFHMVSKTDLEKGFTIEQVEDELVKYTSSFYGARIDFDEYAIRKCYSIATFAYQIIKGNISKKEFEIELDELCNEIEEEDNVKSA